MSFTFVYTVEAQDIQLLYILLKQSTLSYMQQSYSKRLEIQQLMQLIQSQKKSRLNTASCSCVENCSISSASISVSLFQNNIINSPYLLLKKGIIDQVIYYLFNCSMTTNFISQDLAKQLSLISISKVNNPVKGLDGKTISLYNLLIYYIQFRVQDRAFEEFFVDISTSNYDLVLELLWFRKNNLSIDWSKYQIRLYKETKNRLNIQERLSSLDRFQTTKEFSIVTDPRSTTKQLYKKLCRLYIRIERKAQVQRLC